MVQRQDVQQAYYDTHGTGPVTDDDVLLVVDRAVPDDMVLERLAGADLLPDYVADAGRRLYLWHGSDRMSEAEFARAARRITSAPDPAEDRARSVALLRTLARDAFELCAMLQDEDGFDCDEGALARFHAEARPAESGLEGVVDYVASYDVPPCSYLQFLWDGCEAVAGQPLNGDAYLVRDGDEGEGYDLICGWVGATARMRMELALRDATDDEDGRRAFLRALARLLLDVHLHDVRLVAYGVGGLTAMATHAVAAVWVSLARSVGSEHVGTCRVCGKPFVATNERRWKTRYCQPHGGCSRAYARVRQVMAAVEEGATLEEACAQVKNIGIKRVIEIVARNRHALRQEFPGADLEALLE